VTEAARTTRKVRLGRVVSNKMDKTVVVEVQSVSRHHLYSKAIRRQRRFYAHDDANECRIGDRVRIMETRPMSKLKRWRVVEVVERSRE
jgi:small subunit ribosomal protein S17